MDALADVGHSAAEEVAAKDRGADPGYAANDVEHDVSRVGHFRGAGYGRAEGAHDRDEASEDDGATAVLFIKLMGALEVAAAEEERVFLLIEGRTHRAADPIAELIADDGAGHYRKQKPLQRNNVGGGEDTGGDEQGIAGQEEADKESGFDEDNGVDQRSAAGAN